MSTDTRFNHAGGITCILLLLLLGCEGREGSEAGPDVIRETLADGITRVAYNRLPDKLLRLDTLTVIDPWDESLGYHFSRIGDVLGDDDSLFLLDRRNREIVKVGLDGTVMKIIGRQGSGPGEFSMPGGMAWKGEELWVSDSDGWMGDSATACSDRCSPNRETNRPGNR